MALAYERKFLSHVWFESTQNEGIQEIIQYLIRIRYTSPHDMVTVCIKSGIISWGLWLHLQLWQGEVAQSFLEVRLDSSGKIWRFIDWHPHPKQGWKLGDVLPKITSQRPNHDKSSDRSSPALLSFWCIYNGYWVAMLWISQHPGSPR